MDKDNIVGKQEIRILVKHSINFFIRTFKIDNHK